MKQQGVTLVELMVVIAILAILAAFAIPNYQQYLKRNRLEEARSALMENAQFMTRFYTQKYTYKKTSTKWPDLPIIETQFFDIEFTSKAKGEKPDRYRIKAAPKSNYTQENRYLEVDQDQNIKLCTPDEKKPKTKRTCTGF